MRRWLRGVRTGLVSLLWTAGLVVAVGALVFRWEWAVWPLYAITGLACVLLMREAHQAFLADRAAAPRPDEAIPPTHRPPPDTPGPA